MTMKTGSNVIALGMAGLSGKIANTLAYIGIDIANVDQRHTPANVRGENKLKYYLDESAKAKLAETAPVVPVSLAFSALGFLERFIREDVGIHKEAFLSASQWFVANQNLDGVWFNHLDKSKFGVKSPFVSAMTQGLAISVLVRASGLTGEQKFLDTARAALGPFKKSVEEGGVATRSGSDVFLEEYPSPRPHHVLNGFIYALFGLLDLAESGDSEARELFESGRETLDRWLPRFDIGYWSLYHIGPGMKNPATVHYHRLHIEQLSAIQMCSGSDTVLETRNRWRDYYNRSFNRMRTILPKIGWSLFYRAGNPR